MDETQGLFGSGYSQYWEGDSLIGSILNRSDATIHYYNLKNGRRIRTLKLDKEGPNGVGLNFSQLNHHDLSEDSILIINDWDKKFYLTNNLGEVIGKYNLLESAVYKNEGPIILTITNDNKPFKVGNKIFVNCEYVPDDSYDSKGVLLSLDLKSGEFETLVNPPTSYSEYCWGLSYSLNVLSTYNPDMNMKVVSFGVDPNLHVIKDGTVSKYYLPSEHFEEISPYSKDVNDYKDMSTWEKRKSLSVLGPKYYKIVYLENLEMYLREVFLPRSEDDLMDGIRGLRKSMIIIDGKFQKVGETVIEQGKYFTSNFFISKSGIYVADIEHYETNENELKLDYYEPEKTY